MPLCHVSCRGHQTQRPATQRPAAELSASTNFFFFRTERTQSKLEQRQRFFIEHKLKSMYMCLRQVSDSGNLTVAIRKH